MTFRAWALLVVALPLATAQAALWSLDGSASEIDQYPRSDATCGSSAVPTTIDALLDGSVDYASASSCAEWGWQFAPTACARTPNELSCADNATDPPTLLYAFLQKDTLRVEQWRFAFATVDASDPQNVGQISVSGTLEGAAP